MDADILVVGAGPGGSTAAFFLAKQGINVLFVDKQEFPRDKICGDGITPRSLTVLKKMGLAPEIDAKNYWFYEGIRVFAPDGKGVELHPPDRGDSEGRYGYVIPRYDFDDLLRRCAITAGAQFLGGFTARDATLTHGKPVQVKGRYHGRDLILSAKLLIVATGANPAFLRNLSFPVGGFPASVAFRAYFEGVEGIDRYIEMYADEAGAPGYAWIFPTGPISANVGVGWLLDKQHNSAHGVSSRQLFEQVITKNKHLVGKLAQAKMLTQPVGHSLWMSFPALKTYGPNMLVIGEAAGLTNPLTGEGISSAMESAEIAAGVVVGAIKKGEISQDILAQYDQALRQQFLSFFRGATRLLSHYNTPDVIKPVLNLFVKGAIKSSALRSLISRLFFITIGYHKPDVARKVEKLLSREERVGNE